MSGTNHITGGIVFTGIFASFWNVNIFEKPEMLAATGFFAILPDVDHLKSPIGKAFYPLAKFLDKRYGHRTITHSLTVFIPGIFLVMFLEKAFGSSFSYTLVFAFAYFSHLLFDMLTKQGVPLFYPFKRNPCVIPGNPEMRLRSSDLKTEAACFAIFILLGITCQNLFANGFWNTYNRQFSDVKHLHQEAQQSPTMLSVNYNFKTPGNRVFVGKGFLINSTEKEAVIYSSDRFVTISAQDRIISIEPTRTSKILETHEVFFSNISPDSLTRLLHNKQIISLTLQSNTDFSYTKENKPEIGKRAELEFVVNPVFEQKSIRLTVEKKYCSMT
jgi:inner membrane protein